MTEQPSTKYAKTGTAAQKTCHLMATHINLLTSIFSFIYRPERAAGIERTCKTLRSVSCKDSLIQREVKSLLDKMKTKDSQDGVPTDCIYSRCHKEKAVSDDQLCIRCINRKTVNAKLYDNWQYWCVVDGGKSIFTFERQFWKPLWDIFEEAKANAKPPRPEFKQPTVKTVFDKFKWWTDRQGPWVEDYLSLVFESRMRLAFCLTGSIDVVHEGDAAERICDCNTSLPAARLRMCQHYMRQIVERGTVGELVMTDIEGWVDNRLRTAGLDVPGLLRSRCWSLGLDELYRDFVQFLYVDLNTSTRSFGDFYF